jgi:predicted transcriptional regulator
LYVVIKKHLKGTTIMATLSELTVQILAARLEKKEMSLEEVQKEMVAISNMIKAIETGEGQEQTVQEAPAEEALMPQKINLKKYFKDDKVICAICGKNFKSLKRHLKTVHQMTDKEYRAQFGIPKSQSLVAKNYSEERRKAAQEKGLGAKMAQARAAKKAK